MMKKSFLFFIPLAVFVLLCTAFDLEARGGGRGGGGRGGSGRGGSYRGGQSMSRTPSMSRASQTRKNPSAGRTTNQTRRMPSQSPQRQRDPVRTGRQEQNRLPNRPQNVPQNISGSRSAKNELNQFLQQSRASQSRPKEAQSSRNRLDSAQRGQLLSHTSSDLQKAIRQNRPGYGSWFNDSFFNRHGYRPIYANQAVNGWRAATWGAAAGWIGSSWGSPIYYGGDGYPVEVVDSSSGSTETTASAPASGSQMSSGTPLEASMGTGDWLPLGVFAVGKDESAVTHANMVLQLALNKSGDIAGTYYNALTNKVYPVEGVVDLQTQVAALKMSDNPSSPILKTGLYNLTQQESDVSIHFPDGSSQSWFLVRLEEQNSG